MNKSILPTDTAEVTAITEAVSSSIEEIKRAILISNEITRIFFKKMFSTQRKITENSSERTFNDETSTTNRVPRTRAERITRSNLGGNNIIHSNMGSRKN